MHIAYKITYKIEFCSFNFKCV